MPILFRYATEDDAEAVHNLIQAAFSEYRDTIVVPPGALSDTLDFTREAVAEGRTILAYFLEADVPDPTLLPVLPDPRDIPLDFSNAKLSGTARYEPREGHLYIGRVAVHPDYRCHHIGRALMDYIEYLAPTLGYTRLYLGTRASMPGNLAFYERLGYRVVKEEDHPRGPDVNVWFQKQLVDAPNAAPLVYGLTHSLRDLPGKQLAQIKYCGQPYELVYNHSDIPIHLVDGAIKFTFEGIAPRYLLEARYHGINSTHYLQCNTVGRDYGTIAQSAIWQNVVGTTLQHIDILGWQSIPYACRFVFDTASVYMGPPYVFASGRGDDILVTSEAGWQSLHLAPPGVLANLTPNPPPERHISYPQTT